MISGKKTTTTRSRTDGFQVNAWFFMEKLLLQRGGFLRVAKMKMQCSVDKKNTTSSRVPWVALQHTLSQHN